MEKVSAACAMEWSIKLEKALRSKNPVRAVEAILETGEKLKQWSREPEPATAVYSLCGLVPEEDRLFYNTILLRLVDAFCFGDKLVKVAVVRVFMSMFKLRRGKENSECESWFLSKAKVYNHLEMLKRVKSVYDKGDTEAKALALVLFGCWRDFASEFAPVRYLVFTSMVSSHDLEVRASLFAAGCFCEVADDFALVVLGMLNDMVKFPGLMPKTRLAAVRVFAKMGCSHAISNRAFKICMTLMLESSKEDSLVPFLVSLTKLASKSTQLASELAEVIMPFLGEDKSSHVRAAVLRCLDFLIKRGMCFSLVHESETANFYSLLKQAELSPDMQLKALQIFQKILVYKLCLADASEMHQLIAIVENASHSQIFSSNSLVISMLVDIWKEIVRTAEVRSIDVSSTSLPLQLVVLIMNRLTLLAGLCSDPCQVDFALVGEIQDLFNVLHLLVGKHSEVTLLVLDKVRLFLDYIVNLTDGLRKSEGAHELLLGVISYKSKRGVVVRSELLASIHKFLILFLENLEGDKTVLLQVYEKVKRISECVRSCSFLDCHTQMIFALLLHSPIIWGFPVNEMGTYNDADGDSGVSLVADMFSYGIVSLECSTQLLAESSYWPAYRAGVYAARLGAWVTSALIFDKLKTNVKSDSNSFWLKSLTYLSHAEGKLQLLLMPSDGFKLVNWLRSNSYLPELSKDASGEFAHCVALHKAYMNLQSSLGMLGNMSEVFCFQTWFLVLKTRLLETVIDLVECLGLLNQDICNKKKQVEDKILTGCDSLKQLPRICNQLQKLAKEFDMLATCFVDIDSSSSSIITTLSLSCSVLAFAAGIVLFLPGCSFHETLVPFTSQSVVSSRLVQDLVQRLWKVDPEICEMLSMLVKENESLSCSHLQPKNQVTKVCNKVKMLLSICRDAIHGLQNWSNSMQEEDIMSEISKSCRNLLSEAIMKWMQIPFGIPKYFFNIRPCVGAELFAVSSDRSKTTPDTISVEQGFQLSLDLCLQLKNIQQPRVPVRLTKLYCLLYTKLAYHTPTQHGEAKRNQKAYSPWRDEDLVEMSNKLFHHAVTKSGKKLEVSGRFDWNNGVSAVVQFEPNEKVQGFSSCLLDVSRFPVGSYQIKWLSCCIDQHGSYWNLLPLNGKPVFTVKKAS